MRVKSVKSVPKFHDLCFLIKPKGINNRVDKKPHINKVTSNLVDSLDNKHSSNSHHALSQADLIRLAHDRGKKRKFTQLTLFDLFKK